MPIGYVIDERWRTVFTRGWGTVDEAAFAANTEGIRSEPAVSEDWSLLVDLREVRHIEMSGEFLRSFRSAFAASSRRAVLVASDLIRGMSRIYQASSTDPGTMWIGEDPRRALEWLGLPPEMELTLALTATFGDDRAPADESGVEARQ